MGELPKISSLDKLETTRYREFTSIQIDKISVFWAFQTNVAGKIVQKVKSCPVDKDLSINWQTIRLKNYPFSLGLSI